MKNRKFKEFLDEIPKLKTEQFRLLKNSIEKKIKHKKIANILETPEKELLCAFCKSPNYIKWGKRSDLQRYKCKSCCKTFNSLTKTPLARLRRKGHWLEYSNCLKNELTIRNAANFCGIHKNTSFRWRHRFIHNLKFIKAKNLGGIIETGEAKFKESFKGAKKIPLSALKKRKTVFVIHCIDRNNNVINITNKGLNTKILSRYLSSAIPSDSFLYTPDKRVFSNFTTKNKLNHTPITNNHNKIENIININNIIDFRENFKYWIYNHFRGVASKYLENYVSWNRMLNEFKSGINDLTILYRAKKIEKYRHQPLKVTNYVL